MKISICIPVFNYNVQDLVNALNKEITHANLNAEIILIDDASCQDFIQINKSLVNVVYHFIFLKKNIGRSAIRNLFLQYATGDFLLFLDGDAKITNENFLRNYLQFIEENQNTKVIFGGFEVEHGALTLRKKYSLEREIIPLKKRKLIPYQSFRGINFLVKKEVFTQYPFDETIKTYGYEDLIFSKTLESAQIKIAQINNPVVHGNEETADLFLEKTKIALQNLSKIYTQNPQLVEDMGIIKIVKKIKKNNLSVIFSILFKISRKNILKKLHQENPNLKYFDWYKLGLLLENLK